MVVARRHTKVKMVVVVGKHTIVQVVAVVARRHTKVKMVVVVGKHTKVKMVGVVARRHTKVKMVVVVGKPVSSIYVWRTSVIRPINKMKLNMAEIEGAIVRRFQYPTRQFH